MERLARQIPGELLDRSGAVFFSGRDAFRSTAQLYLLGLNPGGDPGSPGMETIREHTRRVVEASEDDWSAYRDESWRRRPRGTWGMQARVLHLLGELGLCPGKVPASNVVFLRSRREADLGNSFADLADRCWPFHAAAMDHLRPRVVLCFGRTAGAFVRRKLGADRLVDQLVERNRRRWGSMSFAAGGGLVVVVATHPSIADWSAPETDPSPLVRRALAGSA